MEARLPIVNKVSAFITSEHRLLVFRKPHHPGTGTQVPGGSIEDGETPERAVVREAEEETGLTGFTLRDMLDRRLVDMRGFGSAEIHDRWFFHLTAPSTAPQAWRHGESSPSSGPEQFIPYDFFWLDLDRAARELRSENHAVLAVLRHRLGKH